LLQEATEGLIKARPWEGNKQFTLSETGTATQIHLLPFKTLLPGLSRNPNIGDRFWQANAHTIPSTDAE